MPKSNTLAKHDHNDARKKCCIIKKIFAKILALFERYRYNEIKLEKAAKQSAHRTITRVTNAKKALMCLLFCMPFFGEKHTKRKNDV